MAGGGVGWGQRKNRVGLKRGVDRIICKARQSWTLLLSRVPGTSQPGYQLSLGKCSHFVRSDLCVLPAHVLMWSRGGGGAAK